MILICAMIRNLWLIVTTHCILKKKIQCLNCNNSYNICPRVKCVKIGCLLSLFQKKNKAKNLKMLLQNIYVNSSVTNGLK